MEKRNNEEKRGASWGWYWVASIGSLVVLGAGACIAYKTGDRVILAAGCICVVLVGMGATLIQAIRANHPPQRDDFLQPLTERLDQLSILINLMSEQQLLSDRAISIAYREKDRELLRRAINEEIARHDWEAALALVDNMERGSFGNKAEAMRLRNQIDNHRHDLMRKRIAEVAQVIDKHTRAEQWNAAIREAENLIAAFPENEQVKNLPHEIDSRRQAHKKQLLQSWHEAVARHDNDGSIEILKQLDPYLTSAEAESMQETVRGVFKERLNNLGAQFTAAVKEQRNAEAVRIGELISQEFPNSRMSQEVRDIVEAMKKRSEPAATPA